MSPQMPRATAGQVTRVLKKLDFTLSRQSGSHKIFRNVYGNRVTVPFYTGKILHPRVLRNIIDDAGLTLDEALLNFIFKLHLVYKICKGNSLIY